MVRPEDKETVVIKQKNAPDIVVKLAEYLDILGSPVRLAILKLLELEPMDIETISHFLWREYGKISSRENTKNHVDKLLRIGLVIKKPGERNNRAVMNYLMVPGCIEIVMRTLSKVMKLDAGLEFVNRVTGVQERISEEFSQSFTVVRILGGVDDGRVFQLKKDEIRIGRIDPKKEEKYDPKNDIVLSDEYRVVSRVWKPHAKLVLESGQWYVEHCEGRNETYLWNKKLDKNRKEILKNGDIIGLAEGAKGVRFVFLCPQSRNKKSHSPTEY